MNSRRGFLQKLFGGAAAAAVGSAVAFPMEGEPFVAYGKFKVRWTGWKTSANAATIAGQWLAYNKDDELRNRGLNFYSSYPGGAGLYYPGNCFDTSVDSTQKQIKLSNEDLANDELLETCQDAAWNVLAELMDGYDRNLPTYRKALGIK